VLRPDERMLGSEMAHLHLQVLLELVKDKEDEADNLPWR
jgi:hypothetical protein